MFVHRGAQILQHLHFNVFKFVYLLVDTLDLLLSLHGYLPFLFLEVNLLQLLVEKLSLFQATLLLPSDLRLLKVER